MTSRLLQHVPLQRLNGVGPTMMARLHKLGLHTVQDLLLYLPFRYEDRTATTPIKALVSGMRTSIEGTLIQKQLVNGRKRMLLCTVSDGTGIITLRFMHFNAGFQNSLILGVTLRAYGEIKSGRTYPEMIHPQFHILKPGTLQQTDYLTPVYYTTEGISQLTLRKVIGLALTLFKHNPPPEILPPEVSASLPSMAEALSWVHSPPATANKEQLIQMTHPAQKRLIIEELLAYQLSIRVTRETHNQGQAAALPYPEAAIHQFIQNLPFALTSAQQRVIGEIRADLQKQRPMMRLLQGDVGSGKTCVAAIAALHTLMNDKQVVLMAPTEILAEQHYHNFKRWFDTQQINIACILGGSSNKIKKAQQESITSGKTTLIIGTHALFYEKIQFAQVGLVIIDEQHRFGVAQRLALWQKGTQGTELPHQLIMTATPIPRTLAMTLYADIRISTLDELPPGRTPITTVVIPNSKRDAIIARIQTLCLQGRQVYWVCTLIEESEHMEAQAAQDLAEVLQNTLHSINVGLIHGRMKTAEKQEIMERFKQGNLSLLVATTVIEVGVDVPNASVMIIENAERLGLAQLHQLRGRVGRGIEASQCILLYQPPLSHTARARLKVMRDSVDGFVIAQKDLEIRGFGEILGTKQMGIADFKIVDLMRDQKILSEIKPVADHVMTHCPDNAQQFIQCWLPDRQKYIHA